MTVPYLCDCGDVIDVSEIHPGTEFICPSCSGETRLENEDPRVITPTASGGGVYDSLLRERLDSAGGLPPASPAGGRSALRPGTRGGFDETTPIPRPGHGSTRPGSTRRSSTGRGSKEPSSTGPDASPAVPADGTPLDVTQESPPLAPDGTLAPGSRVGVFRIDRILGRGGMGVVYEAFDTQLQRTAALKVLGHDYVRDDEHVDRFRREARSAAALSHSNITHIYGMGVDHGIHWFAMELVRGRTLAQVVEQDGPLPPELALEYLHQVVQGMRAAHAKEIIHRDLKPSNLIVSEHGLVKITDFGLAKIVTSSVEITATGIIMGTPLYMSPEQGRGDPVDHRSDIYSLGCTFYQLLTAKPPYEGDTAMAVILKHVTGQVPVFPDLGGVGNRLAVLLTRMMQKGTHQRFQSYDELMTAVASARSTTTRLDISAPGRTILVAEHPDPTANLDPMSLKQLSVADVNLGLGRHEKALTLYHKVLEDHPDLEVELSFRMLKIHQECGNDAEESRLCLRLLELSEDIAERTYCHWKVIRQAQGRCAEGLADSRRALEALLEEDTPEEIRRKPLETRLKQFQELEKRLREDQEGGLLLIRKSGDLQIELA